MKQIKEKNAFDFSKASYKYVKSVFCYADL